MHTNLFEQYYNTKFGMADLPSIPVEDHREISTIVADGSKELRANLSKVISKAKEEDRPLTQEEADEFNKTKNEWIKRTAEKATVKISSITQVHPGDSPALATHKLEMAEKNTAVLTQILNFIGDTIKAIISQIMKSAQWVWDKINNFFSSLHSWLTSSQ